MTFDLGFGNLTASGKKIDLESIKKYDENSDGKIDGNEYTKFLNEVDSDGFNGVSAFGTMDADGDGIVTDEEFELLSQKVDIENYIDNYFEEIASDGDLTTEYQAALKLLAKTYIDDNTTRDITFGSGETGDATTESKTLFESFKEKLESFKSQYADLKNNVDDIKNDKETFEVLQDTVTDANENGYISKTEEVAIRSASIDYAMQQILKGDFSYLENIGATDKEISILKKMVSGLMSSTTPEKALSELKSAITVILADVDSESITAGMKTAKTEKTINAYTVDPLDIDYSSIDGYATNTLVESNDLQHTLQYTFKDTFKSMIQEQCKNNGVKYSDTLSESVYAAALYQSQGAGIEGIAANGGDYTYYVKTRTDALISKFISIIQDISSKMKAPQATEDGVPTYEALATDLLNVDNVSEKGLQSIQSNLLVIDQRILINDADVLNGIKARLKENLGDDYDETRATNILTSVQNSLLVKNKNNHYMSFEEVVTAMLTALREQYFKS